MMLLARNRSYCPLVFAISFSLAISAGFRSAHAQAGLDLPDPEEIQRLINEARSIVATAKECVAVADEALSEAGLANDAKGEAEEARDDAEDGRTTIEDLARMVKIQRIEAEEAAARAVMAATAADAAYQAAGASAEGDVSPEAVQDLENARNAARKAVEEAATAARDAEIAAGRARESAMAAVAAANAAGEEEMRARVAANAAAMDAGLAADAASKAAAAASAAATSAGNAAGVTDTGATVYVNDAKDAALLAAAAANEAGVAAGEAAKLAAKAAEAGTTVVANAADSRTSADVAVGAAMRARVHAAAAKRCAEEVSEREATLATARAASAYLSRTVTSRVQKFRPVGGTSFQRPARQARGMTGINAGDVARPDYPPNLGFDVGYSSSGGGEDLFKARSIYVLVMTDTLLTQQRLAGVGVGMEYTRESLFGSSVRRTRGLTATAYVAEILNETFTLLPQAALTYLKRTKNVTSTSDDDEGNAIRTLCSLTILGQKQWAGMEVSGFGQFAYTYEDPQGSRGGDATYLGQAIAGGEFALPVTTNARLFMGASMDYDVTRSKSTSDHLGYEGKLGLRSPLGSQAEFSLSVSAGKKGEEVTTGGNVFVKIFF